MLNRSRIFEMGEGVPIPFQMVIVANFHVISSKEIMNNKITRSK